MSVRIASSNLNQTPLDWRGNLNNIRESIKIAKDNSVDILCLPELSITGYGCQDLFYHDWFIQKSDDILKEIRLLTKSITVIVGHPLSFNKKRYNSCCIIRNQKILGFFIKSNLPNDGIHYEKRWFEGWEYGKVDKFNFLNQSYPIGNFQIEYDNNLTLGFEICRDMWDEERPANYIKTKKNLIIFNPIASHYAFKKFDFRKKLVVESSKKFNCTYISVNLLGNESGKVIFEGDTILASEGKLISVNDRFSFKNISFSKYDIDFNSQSDKINYESPKIYDEFIDAFSLGLSDYLFKSNLNGFALSLSGGLDSSSIAILTYEMIKRILEKQGIETLNKKFNLNLIPSDNIHSNIKKVINKILFTAYQETENSTKETKRSAKILSDFIGSNHFEWSIDSEVKSITEKISNKTSKKYSWEENDITLQNVQARVRSPFIWFIANANNLLLLSTSNRSESSVGYSTMDGDSSGSISPIAGIDKVFIKDLLKYLREKYNYTCLDNVLSLKPSAELKPTNKKQFDEDDLMPYNILSEIERCFVKERKSPMEIYNILKRKELSDDESLKKNIKNFFKLLATNQWKRERTAPSFHFDDYSLDASTWFRFPILSNNFKEEIDSL
jgi:NAD+ synthase (glutamine-hydrolysing)